MYERRNVVPLLQLLGNILAPDGYALFTDPGRETGREFIGEAARHGFAVETTQTEVPWRNRRQSIIRCRLWLPGGES